MGYAIRNLFCAVFLLVIVFAVGCKEEFAPPLAAKDVGLLVVDGSLQLQSDSSIFELSRTIPVGAAKTNPKELKAVIEVLSESNAILARSVELGNGRYAILSKNLSTTNKYQIRITTQNARQYLTTTLIEPIVTPAIDSVLWEYDTIGRYGIQISVNTHDPLDKAQYYRWEYTETWEYTSYFQSQEQYEPSTRTVVPRPAQNQIYFCWMNKNSNDIVLASNAAISEKLIYKAPIKFIPKGEDKFNYKYSILVKQYAYPEYAYDYWLELKKMTELGGSIFDSQPTELNGNIQCITHPEEKVIGCITAQTVTEKRIFIRSGDVDRRFFVGFIPGDCIYDTIKTPNDYPLYFGNNNYIPLYYEPGAGMLASIRRCADCHTRGGTNVRPAFW